MRRHNLRREDLIVNKDVDEIIALVCIMKRFNILLTISKSLDFIFILNLYCDVSSYSVCIL